MATIRLVGSETAFDCAADDTVTRAGLRAGLPLSYECNTGACGTCKVELVEGEVESLRPDSPAITDRDRAKRRILACQARPLTDCTIKMRLDPAAQVPYRPAIRPARFLRARSLTHDLREFTFGFDAPVAFLPGQYALVSVPGVAAPRAYSMSNIAGSAEWDFQVRRVPGGAASTVLFDTLVPGTAVSIDGPYGHAYLRPEVPRDIVCIAGGSGLAPIISVARGIAATPSMADRRVHVFYGGRRPEDLCGEDMLQALPALAGRVTYVPVVSSPDDPSPSGWTGRAGFVHEAVPAVLTAPLADYEYYCAGPPAMTLAVQRLLMDAKVPATQLHFDQFF
jgi:toluene monooxygenase electron transfer component